MTARSTQKIFISYRRADSLATSGRLYDALRHEFGRDAVFKDLDDIPKGADFWTVITEALETAAALLVVIGPEWSGVDGDRIRQADDFVRLEVHAGLQSPATVVPILVDAAEMPTAELLPSDIRSLTTLNAARLDHLRWDDDIATLVRSLRGTMRARRERDDDKRVGDRRAQLIESAAQAVLSERRIDTGHGHSTPPGGFGPDFPFAYDTWLQHPDGIGSVPAEMHGEPVAIIGGGIAGLVAGHELMKLGLRPMIFESVRLGGRIRSVGFDAAPNVVAEVGAMAFPASGVALDHYISSVCGLEIRPFPGPLTPAAPTTVVDADGEWFLAETLDDLPPEFGEIALAWEGMLNEAADFSTLQSAMRRRDAEEVRRTWSRVQEDLAGRSVGDLIATSSVFAGADRDRLERFGRVGFGTGGWEADLGLAATHVLRISLNAFEDDLRSIVGGNATLPVALWEAAPSTLAHWVEGTSLSSLHAGVPNGHVARIERNDVGELVVTDAHGQAFEVAAVVITSQTVGISNDLEVDPSLFDVKVWQALERSTFTPSSKTFVMVDRPFWNDIHPDTGRPVMSATITDRALGEVLLFDNGPGTPAVILSSSTQGNRSMATAGLGPDERLARSLTELEELYPSAELRRHLRGRPVSVSWENETRFLGSCREVTPAADRKTGDLALQFLQDDAPFSQRGVFLAGDVAGWVPGYAESAVQSALNAVWGVMHHLEGRSPASNPGPGDLASAWGLG